MPHNVVRFAAMGDLLLTPAATSQPYPRDLRLISDEVRDLLGHCDLVFGNLECTLAGDGDCVPTEPRVVATEPLVRAVKDAGFHVVTLANNHMFDCLESGFRNLRSLLDDIGLLHFGAGMNLEEAAAPALLEINGLRIALLGAVERRSGPYRFAAGDQWGVAPLDMDRLVGWIRDLHSHVDHVLISIHWGEERFLVPSPEQIHQAHALVDAGASIVLGHHPHVLQGLEIHRGAPIIYSLGNFLADDVYFSDGDVMRWNRIERTGGILLAELTRDAVREVRLLPTYDCGRAAAIDRTGIGERRTRKADRAVARGVTLASYRREHLWVKTITPALARLKWSELRNLRPRHFTKAIQQILRAGKAR